MLFGYSHLKMGTSVTVTFEGDELEIRLDNPHRQKGEFELCFRSTSDAVSKFCPEGYTSYLAIVREREIVYKLNRYGKLEWLENWAKLKIVFEADGSLNVMLANLPSTMLVYLPNAELPVVTLTMTTTAPTKVKDNKAVISIIGIVVLLLASASNNRRSFVVLLLVQKAKTPAPPSDSNGGRCTSGSPKIRRTITKESSHFKPCASAKTNMPITIAVGNCDNEATIDIDNKNV
uniref:Galectin n=1 Tax=Panagrellus redivivus TaxID=6233 RepID=A0A7E4UQT8_PANRE